MLDIESDISDDICCQERLVCGVLAPASETLHLEGSSLQPFVLCEVLALSSPRVHICRRGVPATLELCIPFLEFRCEQQQTGSK